MAKLRPLAQNKVIKILEKNGFRKIRSSKHITFKKIASDGKILTTWVPHHKEVSIFVIKYIIKQTEILSEEFKTK
ncbi:type II toxin-antitoxin system HicA family toxin [Candidatus Parcubacteria bacterium]|nr:type II toxin-antitoxin system HicA family toxin [Candidatus Parcubacteria bacterium]